jgi:NADH:ubiquinone reductase (H+-translocating)
MPDTTTSLPATYAAPGDANMMARRNAAKHRIVVLGGGFGGVYAAKSLSHRFRNRSDVHVELLSNENYFVFQPLLPEVAAGGVQATHVVNPVRDIVPHAQFRWCDVAKIDTANKTVFAAHGDGKEWAAITYDHLVIALGKISDFRSMPGVSEHALGMKDLSDAFRLRNHMYRCLELADIEDSPEEKKALLTFVIGGGGFSGVETIGELSEMLDKVQRNFRNIDRTEIRLVLVHSRDVILPEMPAKLGAAALRILQKRGIEMQLGKRVKAASPQAVYLNDGTVIPTRTFVCTVGNAPHPMCKSLLNEQNFLEATSEGKPIGVLETNLQLQALDKSKQPIPGHWAVGDCAGVPSPTGNGICPATAQFAIRQATTCADNIAAIVDNKPLRSFSFKALGSLASLGNRSAVADMMGIQLTGFIAWFAWRTVYWSKLPGVARRLRVALDWTLDLFFPRDITQLQLLPQNRVRLEHHEPGETVMHPNEIGRHLYVIKSGTVQVRQGNAVVATLGPGDSIGEKALLTDAPRSATVTALTAVDLVVITRADFLELIHQFPVLDAHFDQMMAERYPELMKDQHVRDIVSSTLQK